MFLRVALLLLLRTTTLLAKQQQHQPAAGAKRMIYVATTGSDASPGTQAQPLASMAGAAKAIAATLSGGLPAGGIEVRVAAGVYEVNVYRGDQMELIRQGTITMEPNAAWRFSTWRYDEGGPILTHREPLATLTDTQRQMAYSVAWSPDCRTLVTTKNGWNVTTSGKLAHMYP